MYVVTCSRIEYDSRAADDESLVSFVHSVSAVLYQQHLRFALSPVNVDMLRNMHIPSVDTLRY